MILLTGNSNKEFAENVAKNIGTDLCKVNVSKFSNGEIKVEGIGESLRGETVYIIHSPGNNVNEELMEVLILANASKYAGAEHICLVSTCYPYARQDKKLASREPITARLMADVYDAAGIKTVISLELHNPAIQGFHSGPTDNLSTLPIFTTFIKHKLKLADNPDDFVVVSPDAGGAKRATELSRRLGTGAAILHKERKKANEVSEMRLLGDVKDLHAIMVDDMADTSGTLKRAAGLLKKEGAKSVVAFVTHGVLSGNALNNIEESDLDKLYVTDSVNLYNKVNCRKIEVITVTNLVADAIVNHHSKRSMGPMFDSKYGRKIYNIHYGKSDPVRTFSDLSLESLDK